MGLDVSMLGVEQLLGSLDCQAFDSIYIGAAGIIAALGVALSILVGQYGALSLEYGSAGVILGGNEIYGLLLPPGFKLKKSRYFRIFFGIIGQSESPEDLENDTTTFR